MTKFLESCKSNTLSGAEGEKAKKKDGIEEY